MCKCILVLLFTGNISRGVFCDREGAENSRSENKHF